jgi:tRNA pseudouridine38-40 synthase
MSIAKATSYRVCRIIGRFVTSPMAPRTIQLVLHYDGAGFAGWQRQPGERTVQGVIEDALFRLCEEHIAVLGAGRTDAGVHAIGQAAGVHVPEKWTTDSLRRALNAVLPDDVWVLRAHEMIPSFHARYDAVSRTYVYRIATGEDAESPFRRRWALPWARGLDEEALHQSAASIQGEHSFRAFAVKGTAREDDDHRCSVLESDWKKSDDGWTFTIRANRFLHHMVRFLVGTMLDIAAERRPAADLAELLHSDDNQRTSPPAPSHALYLQAVEYPIQLYLARA